MSPGAVVFDLFGTLVHQFPLTERTDLRDMAGALGIPEADLARCWCADGASERRSSGGFPSIAAELEHICRELGVEVPGERIREAERRRVEFTRRGLRPRDDAVESLGAVRAAGLRTALVSDCSQEVPPLWPGTPFPPLVDVAVFSCEVGAKKPDPRIYGFATEGLGVAPEDCVYVGDGYSEELSGARAVGMRAVHLAVPGEERYPSHGYEGHLWTGERVGSLTDLVALVLGS